MHDSLDSLTGWFRLWWQSLPQDSVDRLTGRIRERQQNQIGAHLFQSSCIVRRLRRNGDPAAVTQAPQGVDKR